MKKYIKYMLCFIFVLLGLLFYFLYDYNNFKNAQYNIDKIVIKKGDTGKVVIKKLCKKIGNCLNLFIYFKLNNISNIKSGIYIFSGQTISGIFNQFEKGPSSYIKFTILPGETKFDIYEKLKNISGIKVADKFLNLINDEQFIKKLNYSFLKDFPKLKSLEGFLYPDTYFFKSSDIYSILFPELLIKIALKNFQKKWASIKCTKKCNPYKLSNYQNLIIASIVEKEALKDKNKPLISDILIRRYLNNWTLGADWTLCYGLKLSSSNCQNYLIYKYLNDAKNVYNTRKNKSLPPTPVSNPTIQTINATLFPKKNNYWYYLHDKNGNIHFSRTLKEHNYYKNKYLR